MTTLYNACTTIDNEGTARYRITKFVDGEVESSYLTNYRECECPAGVRPTCRHREMLPHFTANEIVNTHLFLEYGGKTMRVVDFQGNQQLPPHSVEVRTGDFDSPSGGSNPPAAANLDGEVLDGEIRAPSEPYTEQDFAIDMFTKDITPNQKPITVRTKLPLASWRRL